jgi:hypothetical protein
MCGPAAMAKNRCGPEWRDRIRDEYEIALVKAFVPLESRCLAFAAGCS